MAAYSTGGRAVSSLKYPQHWLSFRDILTSELKRQVIQSATYKRRESLMRPSAALQAYRDQIRKIVLSHRASNARVFGSVLHGDDTEASDLDLLIDPTPETSMMDIGAIRHELKLLLGVNVDVLTPRALPESFRKKVLKEAIPV